MCSKTHPKPTTEALAEWAKAMLVMQLLRDNCRHTEFGSLPRVDHPAILMQAAIQETFRPASPTEVYSDARPIFVAPSPEAEGQIPIDILLGCYLSRTRTIKIFCKNIAHFASTEFNCNATDLEVIVRLHEYAHALVHIGLFWKEESGVILGYPTGQETNWGVFLHARSKAIRSLTADTREFLAQVLCWIARQKGTLHPENPWFTWRRGS